MPSVGYATIQIIPSVRGISDELRRQLTGPAGDAGGQAGQAAGESLLDKLKVGAAAAGAVAGAILVKGIGDAIGQANVTSKLQAQLGTSNKVASQQGKLAGKLYSTGVADSFESAADAIKSVMQSGLAPPGTTTKQLESLATKASDVANVFDQDLGGVTNAVSQMLRTGLAKSAGQAFDLITKGFQGGTDKAGDFLDTINEYGTQFRKAGLDGTAAIGLLNQAIQGGARDADLAADAIKEFSIRAIDGSDTTAGGFKALGLNADKMAARFAKGGSTANAVLDLTLDRLRGIKDPVKQSQAAVALFGTQAEDLGKALFAMDPSKAAKGLGDIGGAAQKVGDTIRSGPSHEIEVFTRTLQQGLVDFLGGKVLPTVSTLAHGFNTSLLPPIKAVGSVVAATLIPSLTSLWQAGAAVVNWLRDMGTWLIPIGIAVGGFTAALLAQQIATAAVTAVFSIYRGAILAWTAVQRGATIAQAAFNAVMNANPVILVITAIVALGAALYIAYQRSETFRSIVQKAWQGIQAAASFAWNSVLKPAFEALKTAVAAVGQAFVWLWTSVIKPVFGWIDTAARILLTVITVIVFGPIYLAVKLLGAVFSWLWTNAIQPVIGLIVAGFKLLWAGVQVVIGYYITGLKVLAGWVRWLYSTVVAPVVNLIVAAFKLMWTGVSIFFGYFMTGVKTVAGWIRWLYNAAVAPVVGFVTAGFRLMWAGVKVVFGYFVSGLKTLGGWAKWLWSNAIQPAMTGIKTVISTTYNSGIKPVFGALKTAVGQVGKAFDAARAAIKIAWDKVKEIAKAPVSFIVNTVYNKGIVGVWNKVAGAFGAPKLSEYHFATGGVMPGYTPGRDVHLAALSGGEAIMRPEWTRAVGPGYVHAMNAAARHGGIRGVQRALGLPGYKDGGIFGWIGKAGSALKGFGSDAWDAIKKGAKWLKDTLAASARAGVNAVVKPLLSQIPGLNTGFGKAIAKLPDKMIDALFGYADKADKKGASAAAFGGGKIPSGQHKAVITAALRAAGVPPPGTMGQWLSGMNTLISRESGWNASAINRWDSNAKAGHPSQGLAQTIPGTFNAYVPGALRSRGILDPVANVAAAIRYIVARYGNITNVQQANASKPPAGYAGGGSPRPGEIAWVGERGPELIRFRGGEVVYSNADSMRMAATMGGLRGFARGTRLTGTYWTAGQEKARKQVPGDLKGFTKSLTKSASSIGSAAKELAKDLRAAGGAGKGLAVSTGRASVKLQALSKQRDAVASRLATAKQAATDQRKTASDFLGLSNLSSSTSVWDLIEGMQQRQGTLRRFQGSINTLSKKGLSQDLIQQLVAMGPDSQLARVVATASPEQIRQMNSLAKSGVKLASSYGNSMSDAMYDAGRNASKGFLAGLQTQEKELQSAMNRLGGSLVSSIRKKLRIKSPSRVTAELGAYAGQGFALGLDSTASTVAAAAARVSSAALPAMPAPSIPRALPEAVTVELHTRDEALAQFIDVRIRDNNGKIVTALKARPRR